MTRRLFLLAFALSPAALMALAGAQQSNHVPVVGVLMISLGPDHPLMQTLWKRLRELGYVDGQNIRFEFRGAQGQKDRLPDLARELARLKVDVILAGTEPAIWAAKDATGTIPIVMVAYASDPAASGLIDSFGRPGGNLTGIFTRETDLVGKRVELLKEAIPGLTRVAVLWDSFSRAGERDELAGAARALGIQLDLMELKAPYNFQAALRKAKKKGAGAIITLFSPPFYVQSTQIAEAALASRLPMTGSTHEVTRAGGLISYGTDFQDNYYRAAYFIDRLLKGAKPSDLPVEQAAIFKLVVNLKTAKTLGIAIPQSILLRADEVIK